MILLTAEAGHRRRAASRSVGPVLLAFLAWPAVVVAEPAGTAPAIAERDSSHLQPAVLREVPRFELVYPPRVITERNLLDKASLHLGPSAYDIPKVPRPPARHDDALHRALSEWAEPRQPLLNPFWKELANGPPTVVGTQMRLATSEDERSWWARWHGSLWGVSASLGALMIGMVAALSLLPQDVSGWNKPNFYGLKRTFTSGPSFDYDHYYFNYLAHPYDGSEFYLAARNRDCTWLESFLYAAAVSSTFEFVIESAYEGASWQDLWITPVSGAVIGELRWQAKKALEDPKTGKPEGTTNKILHVVIDPLDALFNL